MTRWSALGQAGRRRRQCALLLALPLGLVSTVLPGPAHAQGLISGVLGTAVSPAPGQPPSRRLRGGLALRLNQLAVAGQTWHQLLASDGSHGWTQQALGAEQPVTARTADRAFELMPLPPGHADFLSSVGRPVPEGASGRLTGGSLESYVADMQDNQVPPWLSHSLAPWPRWAMGGVDGYAPLPAMALSWPAALAVAGAAAAAPTPPYALLGQSGLEGLSLAPFLAPLAPALQRLAPAAGARALDLSGAPGKAASLRLLQGAWAGPLLAYRAAAAKPGGLSTLLIFGQGKARALVLLDHQGAPMLAHTEDDAMSVASLVEADLDGDGLPEWLLEMVGVYGDGYYSELWIVDGRSSREGLRIHRLPLSRSSGEAPGGAQSAAWWTDPAGQLWVWRSTPKGSRLASWRYARAGGPKAASGSRALLVLGRDEQYVAARQRQLQALASSPGVLAVLPRQTKAGLFWITAVAAPSAAQAARWAAHKGLPSTAVQALPWAP